MCWGGAAHCLDGKLIAPCPNETGALPPRREPEQVVREIHVRKTAALIRASVRAGAILAGAPPVVLDTLTAFGERIGLAFQIVDDILDVIGEEAKLGKRAGSDVAKATYPSAFGLERSREIAAALTATALPPLDPPGILFTSHGLCVGPKCGFWLVTP